MIKTTFVYVVGLSLLMVFAGGCATKGEMEDMNSSLSSRIAEVRNDLVQNKGTLAEISASLEQMQEDLQVARKQLAVVKAVPALENQTNQNAAAVSKLQGQVKTINSLTAKNSQSLARVEKELGARAATLEQKTAALEQRDGKLVQRFDRIDKLSEELIAELKTIKVFASKLDNEMKSLADQVDDRMTLQNQKMIRDRQALSGILQSEYETLEVRMKQLKEAINALNSDKTLEGTAHAPVESN